MSKANDQFAQKCEKCFKEADKDGKGLSVINLRKIVREMCHANITDRQIAEIFVDLDKDGDKLVSWEEFSDVLRKDPKSVKENELREVFDKLDKDKSGRLTVDEIREAFKELEIPADPDKSLAAADKDSDGKVSAEEFLKYFFDNL